MGAEKTPLLQESGDGGEKRCMKIFIVTAEQGEYSDRSTWVEEAFYDRAVAEEFVRLLDGSQREVDWNGRVRYGIEEVELHAVLPRWNDVTGEFEY
jgi:hypothetical protein